MKMMLLCFELKFFLSWMSKCLLLMEIPGKTSSAFSPLVPINVCTKFHDNQIVDKTFQSVADWSLDTLECYVANMDSYQQVTLANICLAIWYGFIMHLKGRDPKQLQSVIVKLFQKMNMSQLCNVAFIPFYSKALSFSTFYDVLVHCNSTDPIQSKHVSLATVAHWTAVLFLGSKPWKYLQ